MSEVIDISVGLHDDMPVWPGSAGFRRTWTARLEQGDSANVSRFEADIHAGTHIDAPLHFVRDGIAANEIELDALLGTAYVAELGSVDQITARALDRLQLPGHVRRLLLRTSNSLWWKSGVREFRPDYVALARDAASWVAGRGIKTLGVDYLSVQRFGDGPETHQILLGAGVVIIEGLDLSQAPEGFYELLCLPLKLIGAEGAPARAVLRPLRGSS